MTTKDFDYWHERFLSAPNEEIVAEIKQLIASKDQESIAYGFLAIVDGMSRTDKRKLEGGLFNIMTHLFRMKLIPDYFLNHKKIMNHWENEISGSRVKLYRLFKYEPAQKKNVKELIDRIQDDAKNDAIEHLHMDIRTTKGNLPDLTIGEILPDFKIPE